MKSLLNRLLNEPELTPAGVVAGLLVSVVAARFARAAWDGAQREAERQRAASRH